MIYDYTDRVSRLHAPAHASPLVTECVHYVQNHINAPIQIPDVAAHVNRSVSYVSKQFKKEMEQSLNDYINQKKIEESKTLLIYTDKTLSEISNYLCFSSQSYFQNLFKKYVGMTPMVYRNTQSKQ